MRGMHQMRIVHATLIAAVVFGSTATLPAQEARRRWEVLRQIRLDKFDLVLPAAMRAHGIDMWIVAMRENRWDPLYEDLGRGYASPVGYYVFTDRGGDRIERAVLGVSGELLEQSGAYDIVNPRTTLQAFVTERNPKRIGVNVSKTLGPADGLSHTLHEELVAALGPTYAARLTSAERLIIDFRTTRVASEIVAFGEVASFTVHLWERALSNEVVTPGKTTLADVAWWLQDRMLERGASSEFDQPSVYITGPEGIVAVSDDTVIQPGHVVMIDGGVHMLNFGTDIKRVAYVLKPGETDAPASLHRALANAQRAREVVRRVTRVGPTGASLIAEANAALTAAGFVPVAFNQPKPGDSIDVVFGHHGVGNVGHDIGPSMAFFQASQLELPVHATAMMVSELFVYTPIPEWGGKKLRFPIEDDAIVTARGVEWLHPTPRRLLVIK
jgi:Xaa-Pro aminopeptidase